MCDTRTWVFKLLIVFLIIHYSRIQQCRVVAFPAGTALESGGADVAAVDAISDYDDSFETTSSPEDTLSESQRSTLKSTYNNRKSNSNSNKDNAPPSSSFSSSSSSAGSIADRLASDDDVADGDLGSDADDDGSDEEFNGTQRKFNNAAVAEGAAESKTELVFGILKRVEDEKDYVGDSTPNPLPTGSTSVPWDGSVDDDEEDVDEILQPMVIPSDKHHYNSNNGGRVMSPGVGYSMEYHPTGNSDGDEEPSGSNSLKDPSVMNRTKSAYSSAFEQHKALIRNSKRYGHKSHKKKYKDYLHYEPETTTTTTTISPLRRNILPRDRIFNSDDKPEPYYQGQVRYYSETYDGNAGTEKKNQNVPPNHRSNYNPAVRYHLSQFNSGHLRNGGRYRHERPMNRRRYYDPFIDHNDHISIRAQHHHQKLLGKKINEYSQYFSKWPHIAQVEDRLFEDEHTDMLYPNGDDNPSELVLAAEDDEDITKKMENNPNIPPYIRKYKRRNTQLFELLQGTKPPSTPSTQWSSSVLQPGPIEESSQSHSPKHHLRQHRQHHHHRHLNRQRSHRHKNSKWQIEDLFEEQRANPNNPNKTTSYSEIILPTTTMSTSTGTMSLFEEYVKHEKERTKLLQDNKLPAEDVNISRELYDWAIDVGKDQTHSEDVDEDYIDHNNSGLYSSKTTTNARPYKSPTTTTVRPVASVRRPNVYGSIMKSPPLVTTSTAKPINSFVYHRVVEAPRVVGAGQTGRKQRLPFVAITDRRLETSRKGMGNAGVLARKDFEENHFPMP